MTTRTAKKTTHGGKAAPAKHAVTKAANGNANGANGLRVRMYRVGFGDFFLLTVPTKSGPQHILIDCGVHAGDIGSMDDCVNDLAQTTNRKLALVVATHYHADHLSGFATHFDDFAQFEVGAVWITNRLDPKQKKASKFKAQISALASQLQLRLGARDDLEGQQALFKVQNATGNQHGANGSGNEKALRLLTTGFKNKPPVLYYQAGDEPDLPAVLKGAITAELLGPPPIDSDGEFSSSDNKKEQYLAAVAEEGLSDALEPFEKSWPATADDYPPDVFKEYQTQEQIDGKQPGTHINLEKVLHDAQPDELLAMADAVDGTLNNQSLVILFTCQGKKLLFVGDAQWGNWSFWLYGKKVSGTDPGILSKAQTILQSVDFYKVGHHGSTNANPIPAIAALNPQCASMCSTESGDDKDGYPVRKRPYGTVDKGTEVPRIKLMQEMEQKTQNRLVRSDWLKVPEAPATTEAKGQLATLPADFSTGAVYVDYIFPK
jgi:beta-lactamase superfamily II metal-dependent hydrolase